MVTTSSSAPRSAQARALHAQAQALEAGGDLAAALDVYGRAMALAPGDGDLLADLARLATRLDLQPTAAALWRRLWEAEPGRLEAVDGLARALTQQGLQDEAVEALRPAIEANAGEPRLWNALGTVLNSRGDTDAALTFFEEAVRLDETLAAPRYNRGGALFDLGRLEEARIDFAAARRLARRPADAAMIDLADALLALCRGDLETGWDAYEARFSPDLARPVRFDAPGARWTPDTPLEGARLLVLAEQGLGDEIMFGSLLPEVLDAVGPRGRLSVAVDARLVRLFQATLPGAEVTAHATRAEDGFLVRSAPGLADPAAAGTWAPMASLARRFRRSPADFAARGGYLRADPVEVERWRGWLGDGPPAVGLSWRSGKLGGERRRQYPALEDWAPLLRTPGVRFVNLQYGDCAEELAALRQASGAMILEPPGLDLREDLDGLAALATALPMTVSAANATAALAAACGAMAHLLSVPAAWPKLGTESYPWYPQARLHTAPAFGEWAAPLASAAAAVAALAGG